MPRPTRSTRNSVADYTSGSSQELREEANVDSQRPSTASSAMSPTDNSIANSDDFEMSNTKKRTGSKASPAFANPFRRTSRRASKEDEVTMEIDDPLKFIQTPATEEELHAWKGWLELESEPAFFNVMLRDMGVKGVKVQELYSLDEEMIAFVPQPIYGLVFLFQFKEESQFKQEASCPEHIWFANQTTDNACATISLLNLLMNADDIEIGPTLEALREFSKEMTPPLRGYTVTNHDFLRRIHNSFSRRMDMLVSDAWLEGEAQSREVAGKEADENESGFHFVAFVPIQGDLYKLDGLDRQPVKIGTYADNEDWVEVVKPLIQERMEEFGDENIQFNLLAVCKSPLDTIQEKLAENAFTIKQLEKLLDEKMPDWRSFLDKSTVHRTLTGPDVSYGITDEMFASAKGEEEIIEELRKGGITTERLLELQKDVNARQKQLKKDFLEEKSNIADDDETAAARRADSTPVINTWIAKLAEAGLMEELCEKHAL